MGQISVSLPADGSTADVADYNSPINTIVNEFNSGIDNSNIKAGAAIDGSKLASSTITGTQLMGANYTTSEASTGTTWVDGKTIYKKSVDLGSLPNSASKSVAHGITGLESVVKLFGIAKSGTVYLTLPNSDPGGITSCIRLIVSGANVLVTTGTDRTAYTGYATIYYTKT